MSRMSIDETMSTNVTKSSGDEYIPVEDSEEVWKQTSKWRQYQLVALEIEYTNSSMSTVVDNMNIWDVALPEDTERILLPNVHIRSGVDVALNKFQQKFYNRVIQLYDFADEPPVDSVVKDLLDYTDYESNILHFRPKPKMKMEWKGKMISSESDYGVYSDRSRGQNPAEYLLVVEDKRPGLGGVLQPERQLAGEMLIAAYNRSGIRVINQEVFGLILKGDKVRFYRCFFSQSYMRSIINDEKPKEKTRIHRYPPDDKEPLSISHPEQREILIRILCCIREYIEKTIS